MTHEMVKRVAAAIQQAYCHIDNERATIFARAAIEAMKQPTDDVVKFLIENYGFRQNEFWADVWEGAINTILKE